MPRYYFHTAERGRIIDGEGHELPNLPAAQRAAVHLLGGILRHEETRIFEHDFSLQVTDEHGRILFRASVTGELGPQMTDLETSGAYLVDG